MHKKWCRKIDANRQWHEAPPPPKMVMGSIPTGDAVTGPHIRGTLSMREMSPVVQHNWFASASITVAARGLNKKGF